MEKIKENKEICFLCPHTSQPRYHKRANNFIECNWNLKVLAFQREYYKINSFSKEIKIKIIDEVEDKKYFKRLLSLLKMTIAIKRFAEKSSVLYCFSIDLMLIAYLFRRKKKIIVEIGDVRTTNSVIINLIQKFILKKIDVIVVTSIKYQEYYIKEYNIHKEKFILVENKLDSKVKKFSKPKIKNNFRTIGIIGLLRYKSIIYFLEDIIENDLGLNVEIFGSGPLKEEILRIAAMSNKINYHGEFKNPDDLEDIYSKIDLNFVVYSANDKNVRMAIPNKYYESIYFRTPIIVAKNTYLEKMVLDNEIGFSVEFDSKEIGKFILGLSYEELSVRIYNIDKISVNNIFASNEYINQIESKLT